jgi:CDP-diacylglycerol--glycerol-3-phosphate 3-phosphatidyltransferase
MGKSDRALLFGALGFYVGLGGPLPSWTAYLMPAVAGLVALTIVNRIRAGIVEARAIKRP